MIRTFKNSVPFALTVLFLMNSFSTQVFADPLKIALILDRGGKDDKSFNSAAYKGATEAKEKLGIFLKEVEVSDDNLFEPAMRSFAQKKFDLILAIGVSQSETVKKLCKELPDQKFAIVDAKVDCPNVISLMFEEHEGSFLVGYIAGLKSKTGSVGFVGGMDIPLIRRFEMAYLQGAKVANPKIKTISNYIGVTGEAWHNPTKGKELAQSQFSRGVDIIYVAAGASNNGVFDATESLSKEGEKKFSIGVDSNQNWIKPGLILTSMLKRVDSAVFQTIKSFKEGKFESGIRMHGLKNSGIDWALDENNEKLFSKEDIKKINDVKKDIISGKIKVDDYYKLKK